MGLEDVDKDECANQNGLFYESKQEYMWRSLFWWVLTTKGKKNLKAGLALGMKDYPIIVSVVGS
ncbi:conserved hypothetical protein [Ricinus communis]|uniref:Uncharacterized protein n=1 Tax=Ricinus communis TaxID=3988 RepID=B9RGJ6_RICCO|nr:conserved hypothetical protein [Ricinus communis]